MAELKGPILFTGSIGNIRCYYDKTLKRYILSTKGGSTKKLIENNPAFARQRENMAEFKACATWSSQLRISLIGIGHLQKGYYFSGIMSLAKSIQKHDDQHLRGQRSIASSKAPGLLTSLIFNALLPFERMFSQQYQILFSEDKKTVTLKLMQFKSFSRINWPERYQTYRIALVVAQLPDLEWSEPENDYRPVMPDMQRLTVSTFSEWKHCSTNAEDIIMTASFAQPALQQPGTTVVVALGIEVSANVMSGSFINNSGVGTMKIVACFV